VRKRGETLVIQPEDASETTARLIDTSHLVLIGAVDITTPCLHELMRREIPVSWYSGGGWFLGHTIGTGHRNVELRTAQYRASFDPAFCLRFARGPWSRSCATAAPIRPTQKPRSSTR
jgi:CRISPR/Cas system-associated endonuclease Cas1